MKIKFKKLEIHNFMSYRDESFDFEKTKGMNLITGLNHDLPGSKNGAGKSSWALALVFALYGSMPFDTKLKYIPNRYVDDKLTRLCVYLDSDRRHYKIVTEINSNRGSCLLYEIVNGEERDITKSTLMETRSHITKSILNCDKDLFMRTIFLNSDPEYNFYHLSKSDRKEFIDKLFDISLYGEMFSTVHRDTLAMEKDLAMVQNTIVTLNKNAEDYMKRSEEFVSRKKSGMEEIEKSLESAKKELEESRSVTVTRDSKAIGLLNESMESTTDEISNIRLKLQKCEFSIRTLKGNITVAESKIAEREKFISKHDTLKSKLCDDCKVIFSKHYNLGTYQSDIEKLRSQISNYNEQISSAKAEYDRMNSVKNELDGKRTDISRRIREANEAYETSRRMISMCENKVQLLQSKLEHLKNEENPYVSLLMTNNENVSVETEKLNGIKEKYSYAKCLEEIVNQENLKKYIIKDLVGILNSKIRQYLHRLGANYDIVFDENMEYEFQTNSKVETSFLNFSSGEQARISIATCFAFRDFLSMRNSISSNILILDEFIDSNIDSQAIENTIEILDELSKIDKQNIYLVSHRQEVSSDSFDRMIQVEKKNNISSIRYLKT